MKKKILFMLIILSLIISACEKSTEVDAESIATSAAQTVEARFTEMAKTTTPEPSAPVEESAPAGEEATPTATTVPTETPASNTGEVLPDDCLVANFAGETVPDGTIIAPGEYFMKSWSITNNGTCTWHNGYKLVYYNGNLLGGATEYPFFEEIAPGETMTFPIQLLAPTEPGIYEGAWKFQSPSGHIFGVGQYDAPVSVNINVGDNLKAGITSVHYTLDRNPDVGCPTNVDWNIIATITVSGPMNIVAQFQQSDGNHTVKKTLIFDEAGSKNMSVTWTLHKNAGPAPRWVQLVVLEPKETYYPTYTFVNNCPDQNN
jgi:hypothetical protein